MIDYSHIPIWLRITNRELIDPEWQPKQTHQPGHNGLFTDDQVREIRSLSGTHRAIAKVYGCSENTIADIRRGISYREVV